MEYLTLQNRRCEGDAIPEPEFISAAGRRVVILGGGDTGADCLGTVHRQGAESVHQLELMPQPPYTRAPDNPWPQWPNVFRISPAHEEGGERLYAISTQRFIGDKNGRVQALEAVKVQVANQNGRTEVRPVPGSEFILPTDLVLLAMGFTGPERPGMLADFGVRLTEARERLAERAVDDQRARGVHLRGHAARPVADRVGDRGGTLGGARRGRLPDGELEPAGAAAVAGAESGL